jgi:hypothetical protein
MLSRRILAIGSLAIFASPALTQIRESVEVWRDPNCGCCAGWVAHLREEGFAVTDRIVPSVTPFRRMLGTPSDLLSCHAAQIAGWLKIEGHVPALAIRRALAEAPPGVVGLAVPAMPIGTPGMEVPGHEPEVYDLDAWRADGSHFAWMRTKGAKLA